MKNRLISLLLLIILFISNANAIPYSGTVYSGNNYTPKIYNGIELYPIIYEGEVLYPLSYGGSLIDGILYEGFDLSNYKISVHTITGNETSSDFFDKDVPEEYRINWKKVIGKYSVGTTVLVITGILSICSGTIPAATVGYIAAGMFEGAVVGSITGAVTEALITGTMAFFKGEPKACVFKAAIEASADGFMWGAVTGAIAGGFKSAKELSKGKPLLNSKGKITFIKDEKGIIYKAKGGEPQGRVLDKKNSKGEYEFFYDKNGHLIDFDGNIVAKNARIIKKNGILIDKEADKVVAYIDSKGVLHTGDDIPNAIKKDVRDISGNINAKYKNSIHPDTRVPYKEKIVVDEDGVRWRGIFPQFTPEYECRLPKELYLASDRTQFRECTRQLKAALEANPQLKKRFTKEQLEQIMNLDTPDGFTWHHVESPPGEMQLVDFNTHANTRHTGGKSVWGGGKAYR